MKTYSVNPNPTPRSGTAFVDREFLFPSPVRMLTLISSPSSDSHLYFHFAPLSKAKSSPIATNGTESWVPMQGVVRNFATVVFEKPIHSIYFSGDTGASGLPADFAVLASDDIVSLENAQGSAGSSIPNPLPVTGPLTEAELVSNFPLPVVIVGGLADPLDTKDAADGQEGDPYSQNLTVIGAVRDGDGNIQALTYDEGNGGLDVSIKNEPVVSITGTVSTELDNWAGAALSAAIADAPTGSEVAPVMRSIQRKKTTVETTANLNASTTFTGAWHDSELDGTLFVYATVFCGNKASSSLSFLIEQSDDNTNANFTETASKSFSGNTVGNIGINTPSGVLSKVGALIRARYWRVKWGNSAGAATTSLEITSCALSYIPSLTVNQSTSPATDDTPQDIAPTIPLLMDAPSALADGQSSSQFFRAMGGAAVEPLAVAGWIFGGTATGSATTGRNWQKARTPVVFKTVSATASGSTAVWTPGTGNKVRLLKFKVQVTGNATLAVGAVLTIKLLDAAADLNLTHDVFVPTAALGTGEVFDSGWIDLGNYGALSAAVNQALNVNLSAALATGNVRVIACGTEE